MNTEIREFIISEVRNMCAKRNMTLPEEIGDSYSLLTDANLDSVDFFDLLVALETKFGVFCDFGDTDPEVFYTVGGLTECMDRTLKNKR